DRPVQPLQRAVKIVGELKPRQAVEISPKCELILNRLRIGRRQPFVNCERFAVESGGLAPITLLDHPGQVNSRDRKTVEEIRAARKGVRKRFLVNQGVAERLLRFNAFPVVRPDQAEVVEGFGELVAVIGQIREVVEQSVEQLSRLEAEW